jgi:hypothetical protein
MDHVRDLKKHPAHMKSYQPIVLEIGKDSIRLNPARDERADGADLPLETLSLVADYVRANGVRDPNEIAAVANGCVRRAQQLCENAPEGNHTVEQLALELAGEQLGVVSSQTLVGEPNETAVASHKLLNFSDIVPPIERSAMPEQPLGDLHPLVQPRTWPKAIFGLTIEVLSLVIPKLRLSSPD